MKLLKQFIQQETVLTAAAVLAVVSAFFVLPDSIEFHQLMGDFFYRTTHSGFCLIPVWAAQPV